MDFSKLLLQIIFVSSKNCCCRSPVINRRFLNVPDRISFPHVIDASRNNIAPLIRLYMVMLRTFGWANVCVIYDASGLPERAPLRETGVMIAAVMNTMGMHVVSIPVNCVGNVSFVPALMECSKSARSIKH